PAAPEAVGAARQPRDLRLAGAAAVLSGRGTAFFGPGLAGAVAVGDRRAALGRAVLLPLPRHGPSAAGGVRPRLREGPARGLPARRGPARRRLGGRAPLRFPGGQRPQQAPLGTRGRT